MASDPTLTGPPQSDAATASSPRFAPGTLIADRYRVARHLGRGGMGDVYEAEDLELGVSVALKVIQPAIAEAAGMLDRFKRETQLARRITHPSVCRVFDLGYHEEAGQRVSFLTMELIEGETLAQRLEKRGPLPPDEIAGVAAQLCRGLAAAHAAGVIHRDFKSGNVMLVGDRAVVMDFGLARGQTPDPGGQITAQTAIAGTPAYMAPEQVEGGAVTALSDVYAFGVVLFEMLTGQRPFTGDDALAVAARRLTTPAPSPRSVRPEIDDRWVDLVRRCLERDPARRPSATQLVAWIERRRPRRPPWPWVALGLAAIVAVGLFVAARGRTHAVPGARRSVAVLGFTNLGARPETAWIATALAEMLTTEIATAEEVRTIPGETVARGLDMVLPDVEAFDAATLERLRRNLGADVVVHGKYLAVGGKVRFDVRAQDTRDGRILASLAEAGAADEILDLVARGGRRLRLALGAAEPASGGALPANPRAARLYAEGLVALRRYDGPAARDLLAAAVEADPGFALAHSALAETFMLLGHEQRAREEAQLAHGLSGKLPRAERLLVEGRFNETSGQVDRAVEVYRALWQLFPDDLEHGLVLARAEAASGDSAGAQAILAALRRLPAPVGNDPRIDLTEAEAARLTGDSERRRGVAIRAAHEGAARGSRFTVGQARTEEAWSSFFLGDLARARTAFAEAQTLALAIGARSLAAEALFGAAHVSFQEGQVTEGRRLYEASLAVYRETGDRGGQTSLLSQLGYLLAEQGELTEALALLDQAIGLTRVMGDDNGLAQALYYRGWTMALRGNLKDARQSFVEARALTERRGNRALTAYALHGLGVLLFDEGDLPGARAFFEESITILESGTHAVYTAYSMHGLARVLAAGGKLEEARVLHEKARAARIAHRQGRTEPESVLALAEVAADAGDLAAAEALAREAAGGLHERSGALKEAAARALHAVVLTRAGRVADGRAELARAEALDAHGQSQRTRLVVELAAGEILAASPAARDRAAAAVRLDALAVDAARAGFYETGLRARLLGARGRAARAAIAAEAQGRGYLLLAEQARRAAP